VHDVEAAVGALSSGRLCADAAALAAVRFKDPIETPNDFQGPH
jgi:hypothetical protein